MRRGLGGGELPAHLADCSLGGGPVLALPCGLLSVLSAGLVQLGA
ncbi:hypothetical protein ACBR40_45565 [Nonomuraea sp. AD125B]